MGMDRANDTSSAPDIAFQITQGIRSQRDTRRELFECDFCRLTLTGELKFWHHLREDHPESLPQGDAEQQRYRIQKRDSCRKRGNTSDLPAARSSEKLLEKGTDITARHTTNTENFGDAAEKPYLQWQARDLGVAPQSPKLAKKLETGSSTWSREHGELTGSPGVQEIEQKTSGITLEHDADVRMADAEHTETARSPRNGRKRTGTDPMEGAGVSQIREHFAQSPKRSRAQTTKRYETTGRGGNVPASGRPRKHQQPVVLDPEFDRSRFDFEHSGENEDNTPVRATPQQRRLFDPQRDSPGAFRNEEDPSKRLEEPVPGARSPQNVRSKREQKKKEPRLYNHRAQQRNVGAPVQQQQQQQPQPQQQIVQGSREGGRIMILNNVTQQPQHQAQQLQPGPSDEEDDTPRMVGQPETRPISPEQLIAEVKGIYAGLVMVEAKCCEVDAKQAAAAQDPDGKHPRLNNEQWQALIALHRTLLHEHHDFFLASQHPSASPSLRRLALKYAMPARMWRHGIHSFLELLRHRLPYSLEHMLTFIYLAYSMMALLYETVPAFEDTWVECLGDLGRYRMAIEDDDIRDRDVWANVARFWYSKAADKTPHVGRLHHHLAILARPNVLQQLFYYCKSLGVTQPFSSARESILTLFDPIFAPDSVSQKAQPVDTGFIQLHGINFTHIDLEKFDEALYDFLDILDRHIGDPKSKWKVPGGYIAVCNIIGLFQYGAKDSLLRQAWRQGRRGVIDEEMEDAPSANAPGEVGNSEFDGLLPPLPNEASSEHVTSLLQPVSKLENDDRYENKGKASSKLAGTDQKSCDGFTAQEISLGYSKRLAYQILTIALQRVGDANVLPHVHLWLVFMMHIRTSEPATRLLENEFPWDALVTMLNFLIKNSDSERFEGERFPVPEKGFGRPLPEDYTLRGLDWAKSYFPERWFKDAQVDDEERSMELPSMANIRVERILWIATRIAAGGDHLAYKNRVFVVHPSLLQRIEESKNNARAGIASNGSPHAQKQSGMQEDSDVDMTTANEGNESEDDDYVLVGQSEEVRRLKQQQRELRAQLRSGVVVDTINEVKHSVVKGAEALKSHYTVLVVDTNLLLSHPETFKLIVLAGGWSVVIPNCVITELLGLAKNPSAVRDTANAAIKVINDYLSEKKDIKVVTAKGNNVTNIGFYKEQLEKHGEDEIRNIDDIIIQTTKQQREVRRQMLGDAGEAEPAVLITEDRNMRVKANARGVTAIAASTIKRTLSPRGSIEKESLGDRSKDTPARPKRKSFGTPVAALKQRYPEWQEDEIAYALSESNGDVDGAIAQMKIGGNKKRQHKRGRVDANNNLVT